MYSHGVPGESRACRDFFLLSFLFPFLSPLLNHSIAARLLSILSLSLPCYNELFIFLLVHCKSFPSGLPPTGSGTPAPCCASNLESDRTQFPDFLQPLPVTVRLLYVVCTNLSLRTRPPAVCSVPQKSGSTTVILRVICIPSFTSESFFPPFRAYIHKCHRHRHSTQRACVCVVVWFFY